MTKQEYKQITAHYNNRQNRINKGRKDALQHYVDCNAEYPIGTTLEIEDYGKEKIVTIQKYKVDKDFKLEPVFVGVDGSCQFTDKPTIIKVLD